MGENFVCELWITLFDMPLFFFKNSLIQKTFLYQFVKLNVMEMQGSNISKRDSVKLHKWNWLNTIPYRTISYNIYDTSLNKDSPVIGFADAYKMKLMGQLKPTNILHYLETFCSPITHCWFKRRILKLFNNANWINRKICESDNKM